MNVLKVPAAGLCLVSAAKTLDVRAALSSPSPNVPGEIKAIILSGQPSNRGAVSEKSVFIFYFSPCEPGVLSSSKVDTASQHVNHIGLKSMT